MSRGKTVLNLFSYAGGFSLRAALGGATHVTSVDVAAQAHATAQESFKRAGVANVGATSSVSRKIVSRSWRTQSAAEKNGSLVVSDPPSFAPNAKAVPGALSAYRSSFIARAFSVLAPGGIFCAASCSSHVNAESFATTLDDAALERDMRLVALQRRAVRSARRSRRISRKVAI